MNWEAIGAVGEILGAIGVIFTLLYLAYQLRQNTRAMKSATLQSYSAASLDVTGSFAECSEIIAKDRVGDELSDAEAIRLQFVYVKLFAQMEGVFLQHRQGSMDQDVFEARMSGFGKALKLGPRQRSAWDTFKHFDLTPDFVDYVDHNLLDGA